MGLIELTSKRWQAVLLLGGSALGENPLSCLFQFRDTICIAWLLAPFKASNVGLSLFQATVSLVFPLLPPSSNFKDPWDYIGPTQVTEDNL